MSDSSHAPGELPPVHDEAVETPLWFPALGVGLLALFAFFLAFRQATADEPVAEPPAAEATAAEAPAADAPAEGEAAGAPVAAPRPAPAPAAAPRPAPAPAAPAGERDAFGRAPGDEHFGHGHE